MKYKLAVPKLTSKRPHVEYYVLNVDTGKLDRKRDYTIEKIKNKRLLKQEADALCKRINSYLTSEHLFAVERSDNRDLEIFERKVEVFTLIQAMNDALEVKSKTFKEKSESLLPYKHAVAHLVKFLESQGEMNVELKYATKGLLRRFFDYLITSASLSPKTHNNILSYISPLFSFYVEREVIPVNPTSGIKRLKSPSKRNKPFTNSQVVELKEEVLRSQDKQIYLAINIMYYCFIRGKELRYLKVGDIKEKVIHVRPEVSKVGKARSPFIPDQLSLLLEEYGVRNYNEDFYLFTANGVPGPVPAGRNYLYDRFKRVLKAIGLFKKGNTFYSLKHTGNIDLLKTMKNPRMNQRQNGHTSLAMTEIYIRDFGIVYEDEKGEFKGI